MAKQITLRKTLAWELCWTYLDFDTDDAASWLVPTSDKMGWCLSEYTKQLETNL